MISRYHDLWLGQEIQKVPGAAELFRTGPLRQISGDHHQIRLEIVDRLDQLGDNPLIGPAKVYVG